jgi:two-component system cell cycle response regulator CtrA
MSGYEVLRSLRVSKVKTPILILTGLGGIEDKVRGLGFVADDYMTKPFHKDELVARIYAIVIRHDIIELEREHDSHGTSQRKDNQ